MVERKKIKISGRVQGVGFRPCIYQIAKKLALSGWVRNDASGVTLEIQGISTGKFLQELQQSLPPLAKMASVQVSALPVRSDEYEFSILQSLMGKINTLISPDIAVCSDCLEELFDQSSRFYRYPFLNCTQCGPRLTITHQLPYDRYHTAMSTFLFCEECDKDYHDPNSRRYHAQPTACAQCGPSLSVRVLEIAENIQRGRIVALKGVGGYQLICDASNPCVIDKLRRRKNRPSKPFAMMVLNVESAREFAEVSEEEALLLKSVERPIVLLAKKSSNLPIRIAPNLSHLGMMLPYTPLHYLIFNALLNNPDNIKWLEQSSAVALIVTSANFAEDPIVVDDNAAHKELNQIADLIVSYNRQIVTRIDDSVLRVVHQAPCFIRRARGYVPVSIKLPHEIPVTLALGGYLKNTFCITRKDEAFLSQHIGDLKNRSNREFFHESLAYLLKFLDVEPECVAHDYHPDFYTTQLANEYQIPAIPVQHHHAHLAAVMAEYQLQEPTLGLALDGHGYGLDGTAWGGELFLLDHTKVERLNHLQPFSLPCGDKAAREPWYMGASVLHSLGLAEEITQRFSDQPNAALLKSVLENKVYTPTTTSCGRLFDAAAALLGVHLANQYEGQAAMKLESLVTQPEVMRRGWYFDKHGLSLLPVFLELLHLDAITGANIFHGTLIAAFTDLVLHYSKKTNVRTILLSGGCFLNKVLSEGLIKNLNAAHLTVLFPKQVPPNDGGISLGQAWIGGLSCV